MVARERIRKMSIAAWFKCDCGAETFLCSKSREYECYHCGAIHKLRYDPDSGCKELYGFFKVEATSGLEVLTH